MLEEAPNCNWFGPPAEPTVKTAASYDLLSELVPTPRPPTAATPTRRPRPGDGEPCYSCRSYRSQPPIVAALSITRQHIDRLLRGTVSLNTLRKHDRSAMRACYIAPSSSEAHRPAVTIVSTHSRSLGRPRPSAALKSDVGRAGGISADQFHEDLAL